ncbi:MAG: GtrA family protein [Candidatus Cloacimonetes bacterium]|nr:GtrA family protein [Candidatus Cloacimonadota bacterium]
MLKKVFISTTHNTALQLMRYITLGSVAYFADLGSLWLMTEMLKLHYLVSAAISFILGQVINFLISRKYVFPPGKLRRTIEFILYLLIGCLGLLLNLVLIWIFTDHFQLHYMLSKIFSNVFVFLASFFARKFFLFHNKLPGVTQ